MKNLLVIAGPCVVENEKTTMLIAEKLVKVCKDLPIHLVFKSSYRKANRTQLDSFTGIGDIKALRILAKVHTTFKIDVTTDIHEAAEAAIAAEYVDVIQIPAFLCRQTELLLAAARTNKTINIKKGQFMAADAMEYAVAKIGSISPQFILVTERGNTFGYNEVVIDMRNIPTMQRFCDKVLVDITHTNGGSPAISFVLGRAAIAAKADGVFFETHPDPSNALSDGKNMISLNAVEDLLNQLIRIKEAME